MQLDSLCKQLEVQTVVATASVNDIVIIGLLHEANKAMCNAIFELLSYL